jgi:hypothetical protein
MLFILVHSAEISASKSEAGRFPPSAETSQEAPTNTTAGSKYKSDILIQTEIPIRRATRLKVAKRIDFSSSGNIGKGSVNRIWPKPPKEPIDVA